MSILVVDTHEFIESLEAAVVKRAQAEAILENIKRFKVDSPSHADFESV